MSAVDPFGRIDKLDVEAHRRLMPQTGAMTEDEADAWAAALRSDSEAGVFFGSCNYYAYVARRPQR